MPVGVFAGLFARGGAAAALDDQAWLQALLDVEAGLARALARAGLAPESAARAVQAVAQAGRYSLSELAEGSAATGNPVPALVRAMLREVGPLGHQGESALHVGATSQDVVDSALMLLLKRALPHVLVDLDACANASANLTRSHGTTLMAGRTLLQHAIPVTFGLKAATWLHALDQLRVPLAELLHGGLPVQFGGAAGSLAALEGRGLDVMQLLAEELELSCPALPWHTVRLPILEVAGVLGRIAAISGKIARDLSLLAQSEVDEVREAGGAGAGHGGSSSMPHKHNPIGSIAAISCCRRVPGLVASLLGAAEQEHERAAGGWHAEWEPLTELVRLVGSAVNWLRTVLEGLEVDSVRMRRNLDATLGLALAERLSTALMPALGRNAAQAFVAEACVRAERSQRPLLTTLNETPQLMRVLHDAGIDPERLSSLLEPANYLGNTHELIERALTAHAACANEIRARPETDE
jgi:3-carboxy-cis,cis-muconate cycloisomerase